MHWVLVALYMGKLQVEGVSGCSSLLANGSSLLANGFPVIKKQPAMP
jgi:hypothetical protein